MNLYLIAQKENDDDDTYDSAVVIAYTEEGAMDTDPLTGPNRDWSVMVDHWCNSRESVRVEYLGELDEAARWPKNKVICASFNAE